MTNNQIPVVEAGSAGAYGIFKQKQDETKELQRVALESTGQRKYLLHLANWRSRRWLQRSTDEIKRRYYEEIRKIGEEIEDEGLYLLNLVYEWACSTSAGPDPSGDGNRLIRVLDWGMSGIGRFTVLAEFESYLGSFYGVTWPGYVGVLTAMAPGRFAAAINQAPVARVTGVKALDKILDRLDLLFEGDTVPAPFLLRRAFETQSNYDDAARFISDETIRITEPASFILSGVRPEQACVIEARGRDRRRIDATSSPGLVVAAANDWQRPGWRGHPRGYATAAGQTDAQNNEGRRTMIAALAHHRELFWQNLESPLRNECNVHVVTANANARWMQAEAIVDYDAQETLGPTTVSTP